ncbi:MAG: hypothetical protein GEV08_08615 [Acidimicrobiia bacterium]|nr:hypothetical protein [Acidimicrobiia bacterium]
MPLRWVEELVNTRNVEDGSDELADPAALAAWFVGRGLLPAGAPVDEAGRARAAQVREGLRALIAANNGGEPPSPAAEGEAGSPEGAGSPDGGAAVADGVEPGALDALARTAPGLALVLELGSGRPRLVPAHPGTVDGALAALLAAVAEAVADGSWARLKACREPGCRWAYYDHSRNRSRAWCSMAVCGNRAKARAFRRRGR